MSAYGEIEVGLHRVQPEVYEVELRVTDPDTQGEIAPAKGQARISFEELLALQDTPDQYGETLARQLFQDERIRELYSNTKAAFDSRGLMLRLRLLIAPSVPELHGLRWELLHDPKTNAPLATSERILFSRFTLSRDWRLVKLRPKAELKALIAVAAPSDVAKYNLAEVDKEGEIARARAGLAGIQANVAAAGKPLTLGRLMEAIRQGVDILYLVCHGVLPKGLEACLFLQDEEGGVARVMGSDLAQRISELTEVPRLVVLASCESAGTGAGTASPDQKLTAQSALAPRLAEAGVPAVLAMQGKISMETVKRAMPEFCRELVKDGQIDRAMAVARGVVRERPDSWMPALFLRLKNGRIWYEPGFGGEGKNEFEKWSSICAWVRKGEFIPILGPELAEDVFGGTHELANRLAERHTFPLASHERTDLAKVTQYISTNQSRRFAQEAVQAQFLRQLSERIVSASDNIPKTPPQFLELAIQRCRSDPDHPYCALADLRASIYLNASYEPMLLRSLQAAGRNPEAIFTSWRGNEIPKQPQPKVAIPTPETPWVYHVFGLFGKPDTMVLTEDDFFDYLIATSRLDLLLPTLVGRLMQSSLLFLGFRLDDWRFRVLFRMIVTRPGTETMKELSHVGVQVNPDEQSFADVERARKYMETYFQGGKDAPEISIYWGTAADFLKELHKRLADMTEEAVTPVGNADDRDWFTPVSS